jgi:hypothetical protein
MPSFGHIILVPSQPLFALTPEYYVLSGESTNTNVIMFGLTRRGIKSTIYRTAAVPACFCSLSKMKHRPKTYNTTEAEGTWIIVRTLYNLLHYYIMILIKQLYWLSCCHLPFRKIWYCLIKTRIDSLSLSLSIALCMTA